MKLFVEHQECRLSGFFVVEEDREWKWQSNPVGKSVF